MPFQNVMQFSQMTLDCYLLACICEKLQISVLQTIDCQETIKGEKVNFSKTAVLTNSENRLRTN